jgi:CubicO group peptidase (beta-lactamase class C family)
MIRVLYVLVIYGIVFLVPACDLNKSESGSLYSVPPEFFDGWPVSHADNQDVDSERLAEALIDAEEMEYLFSIMVVRNGYLIGEQYYHGHGLVDATPIMSVSKSFLSALIGIALREGYITDLDEKVMIYFPEYWELKIDDRFYDITLRHLLMMCAGIDRETNNYFHVYESDNWIRTTLRLPLLSNPGERMRYNTFQTHLLSAILTKATGMSTHEFAEEYLTGPILGTIQYWEQDPQGYYFGGNGMSMTPRDMTRLGLLYRNNGYSNRSEIVPQSWIDQSTTNYTGWSDYNWGALENYNYGYLWWLGEIRDHEVYLAIGHGGQYIVVFPDLDLIVSTTAHSYVDWDTADLQEQAILEFVADHILPAVEQQ